MFMRSQNRAPRSPSSRNISTGDVPPDKRRKIGSARSAGVATVGRGRQPLAAVNNRQDVVASASDMGGAEGSECESVEFTKEEVEALLNEKVKGKKFDVKGKMEQMNEHIRKLKLCVKWFQEVEDGHVQEKEKLRNTLESSERKLTETEAAMTKNEEEFNSILTELKLKSTLLQENLAKEESEKLDAIECHRRETEAKVTAEKLQASLREELGKAEQDKLSANQRVISLNDMYKRLQEYNTSLQQYNTKLQTDLATANESLKRVENEKATIVQNLSTLRGHYNALQDQLTSSKASQDEAVKQKEALLKEVNCIRVELQHAREDRDRQCAQVQELTAEIVKYKETTGKSVAELDNLSLKSYALEETCSSQREQIHVLQHQLAAATEKLKMSDLSVVETRTEFEQKKRAMHELQDRLADAELKLVEGEKLRKKLHNTILELKGNIRVFCRVRPMLPDDCATTETPISYPMSMESLGRGIELLQSGQKYPFTFDKVFDHEASQQDVFVEISQLVQSALDGYKVCIFAYGQTGSGKTYTMMGVPEAYEQKGLIPRSLEQIFETSQSLQAQGWKYKMQASMLEIYNETIRDLLSVNCSSGLDLTRAENCGVGKQYAIKHDANGNTHVADLTIVDVCSMKEVSRLLRQAAQSRSVGKTDMNEHSSRSHFVFTLRIFGVNESTEQQVQGVLNLIDLAGSERLSRSGATGDRLKETQAINKSLSCLSDVIFALAKKDDHVPFRNSKLTYLLQPCLGGDSKTLMFVNVSPDPLSVGESICSLRFAARVNSCEIGIARRQTSTRTLDSRLSCG
ncbi:kinesin-like protein KIN-14D [Rhododendron vialii]|uniref:kinesin-like protein KIN-14D n=1 Tax=Rhododendron vialii TaxID=182163 RepID=UPI00265E3867|nr:kinesin-like protein KIN-14D [Rhododendron vialii]